MADAVIEMVGPDDLPNAVGLNSIVFNSARIISGPTGVLAATANLSLSIFRVSAEDARIHAAKSNQLGEPPWGNSLHSRPSNHRLHKQACYRHSDYIRGGTANHDHCDQWVGRCSV